MAELTERERDLMANPDRVASIKRGVEQAHAGLAQPVDLTSLTPGWWVSIPPGWRR